jgi:hypothetical protein
MLSTGMFPTALKFSQVIAVFKKGNIVDISVYKLISLPTSFSKSLKKLSVIDYFKKTNSVALSLQANYTD